MPAQAGARRRASHLLGRVVAVLVLTVAAVVAGAGAASAHAALLSSSPGAGAAVRAPLAAVRLTFTEAVATPAYVLVTGPAGRADAGAAQVRGAVVSVGLRSDLTAGQYTVAYRVVSDDGHPIEDTFTFRLSAAPASSPAASAPSAPSAPAAPALSAPAPASAPAAPAGDHSGHWFMGFAGVAMAVAGAGALLYERRQRGADDGAGIDVDEPLIDADAADGAEGDAPTAATKPDGSDSRQDRPS